MGTPQDWINRHKNGENWAQIGESEGLTKEAVRNRARRHAKALHMSNAQYEQQVPPDLTLEEFVDLARKTQEAIETVDPIFISETITIPDNGNHAAIIFCSCEHLGSRFVNHRQFVNLLDRVLDIPDLYWIGMGDQIEGFINFFDAGSTHEQALADPKLQRRMLALILDKLAAKGKLLCSFSGQHSGQWERQRRASDPVKQMHLDRAIRYFDGAAYIKLKIAEQTYRMFGAHELPGASLYNRVHAHKKAALFKAPNADVIFAGDKHVYSVHQESIDTFEFLTGDRPSYIRWLVQIGSAKTGNDIYTIKNWSPAVFEWPILVFRRDEHRIAQAPDLNAAKWMLSGQW